MFITASLAGPDRDRDAVRGRVNACRLERHLVDVDRLHRREAELRGRNGEDPGAAADVEQARRLHVLQELEAEPGGRMRPRPERTAGVDHDRDGVSRGILPRGPDPATADPDAVMKSAPAVLPAFDHVVHRDDVEPDRRLVGVDREGAVELLDTLREDVEQ
jgi:hypothetical protein